MGKKTYATKHASHMPMSSCGAALRCSRYPFKYRLVSISTVVHNFCYASDSIALHYVVSIMHSHRRSRNFVASCFPLLQISNQLDVFRRQRLPSFHWSTRTSAMINNSYRRWSQSYSSQGEPSHSSFSDRETIFTLRLGQILTVSPQAWNREDLRGCRKHYSAIEP